MSSIAIDSFKALERLKSAGFNDVQAKAVGECFRDIDAQSIATKQDVQVAVAELKADVFKWFIPLFLGQYGLLVAILMKMAG